MSSNTKYCTENNEIKAQKVNKIKKSMLHYIRKPLFKYDQSNPQTESPN